MVVTLKINRDMKEFDAKYEDYEAIYGERENEDENEVEDYELDIDCSYWADLEVVFE